jgi:hypothetical protein
VEVSFEMTIEKQFERFMREKQKLLRVGHALLVRSSEWETAPAKKSSDCVRLTPVKRRSRKALGWLSANQKSAGTTLWEPEPSPLTFNIGSHERLPSYSVWQVGEFT